jgi:hypothetical protein
MQQPAMPKALKTLFDDARLASSACPGTSSGTFSLFS